ncbi:hypothetical protein BH10PLA1_BH10PLA1_17190 [soil metagenome]
MSIVLASSLSASDLRRLGNNLGQRKRPVRRYRRHLVEAVNRSLATVGEQIDRLHRPTAVAY